MTTPVTVPAAHSPEKSAPSAPSKSSPLLAFAVLLVALAVPLLVGYLSAISNQSSIQEWFDQANRAPWAIDAKYYPIMWAVLSVLPGLAFWLVWLRRSEVTIFAATVIFLTNVAISAVWLSAFFNRFISSGNTALWIALILALLHLVFIVVTIAAYDRASKLASWILIPYLVGVCYLASVNVYSALNNY